MRIVKLSFGNEHCCLVSSIYYDIPGKIPRMKYISKEIVSSIYLSTDLLCIGGNYLFQPDGYNVL